MPAKTKLKWQLGATRMRRLVFIDDDRTELEAFREIVQGDYHCTTVYWPDESSTLFSGSPPDIFVSDLYLPPPSGDTIPTEEQRESAAKEAKRVADQFSELYADSSGDDKSRLRKTMDAIADAFVMLKRQWGALGQSPDNGVELLTRLKSLYPEVPLVFYSRKITPENVICVLQAGAVDAIRKGAFNNEEMLARLTQAQQVHDRKGIRNMRAHGLNVNVTLISKK